MSQLEWPVIIHELGLGHPMKFIWEKAVARYSAASVDYPGVLKDCVQRQGG
jgi:hypothetical protein